MGREVVVHFRDIYRTGTHWRRRRKKGAIRRYMCLHFSVNSKYEKQQRVLFTRVSWIYIDCQTKNILRAIKIIFFNSCHFQERSPSPNVVKVQTAVQHVAKNNIRFSLIKSFPLDCCFGSILFFSLSLFVFKTILSFPFSYITLVLLSFDLLFLLLLSIIIIVYNVWGRFNDSTKPRDFSSMFLMKHTKGGRGRCYFFDNEPKIPELFKIKLVHLILTKKLYWKEERWTSQ